MPTQRQIEVEIRYKGNIFRILDKIQDFNNIFKARCKETITKVRRDNIIVYYDGFNSKPSDIISYIKSINEIYSIKLKPEKFNTVSMKQ